MMKPKTSSVRNVLWISGATVFPTLIALIGYGLSGDLDNILFSICYLASALIAAASAVVFALRVFRGVANPVLRASARLALVIVLVALYLAISFLVLVNVNEWLGGRGI